MIRKATGMASVAIVVVIAVVVVVAALGVWGAMVYLHPASGSSHSASYCPLDVSSSILVPTPGTVNNSSHSVNYSAGSVVFAASASGCTAPYTYLYTFGDGTSSSAANVTHVYTKAGYYSGSLVVTAATGYASSEYFCVDASTWPNLTVGSGNPAPACP